VAIVKITIRELRRIIRESLGAKTTKTMFSYLGNPLSPDISDREQLGSLAVDDIDTINNDDNDLPLHLREPEISQKDTMGPVPPTDNDPYVRLDPYTKDLY
jgi:hypothetical protein